jgi:hypothetical protein
MPKSLGINLANCVLDKLIHNNEMVKMLRFAGQTHNSRKLYISPTQSTFCSKYIVPKFTRPYLLNLNTFRKARCLKVIMTL